MWFIRVIEACGEGINWAVKALKGAYKTAELARAVNFAKASRKAAQVARVSQRELSAAEAAAHASLTLEEGVAADLRARALAERARVAHIKADHAAGSARRSAAPVRARATREAAIRERQEIAAQKAASLKAAADRDANLASRREFLQRQADARRADSTIPKPQPKAAPTPHEVQQPTHVTVPSHIDMAALNELRPELRGFRDRIPVNKRISKRLGAQLTRTLRPLKDAWRDAGGPEGEITDIEKAIQAAVEYKNPARTWVEAHLPSVGGLNKYGGMFFDSFPMGPIKGIAAGLAFLSATAVIGLGVDIFWNTAIKGWLTQRVNTPILAANRQSALDAENKAQRDSTVHAGTSVELTKPMRFYAVNSFAAKDLPATIPTIEYIQTRYDADVLNRQPQNLSARQQITPALMADGSVAQVTVGKDTYIVAMGPEGRFGLTPIGDYVAQGGLVNGPNQNPNIPKVVVAPTGIGAIPERVGLAWRDLNDGKIMTNVWPDLQFWKPAPASIGGVEQRAGQSAAAGAITPPPSAAPATSIQPSTATRAATTSPAAATPSQAAQPAATATAPAAAPANNPPEQSASDIMLHGFNPPPQTNSSQSDGGGPRSDAGPTAGQTTPANFTRSTDGNSSLLVRAVLSAGSGSSYAALRSQPVNDRYAVTVSASGAPLSGKARGPNYAALTMPQSDTKAAARPGLMGQLRASTLNT